MDDLQRVMNDIAAFCDERDWGQFHNPKDLALSISIEAAELLEVFQWSGQDNSAVGREEKIEEELADVLIYCLDMARVIGADPIEIIEKKMALNRAKYPVETARGTARKYTEL